MTTPIPTPDPEAKTEPQVVTPAEPVPEPVDDGVIEAEPITAEPRADHTDGEPEPEPEPTIINGNASKRDQIAKMYKEQRDNPPDPDPEPDPEPEPDPDPEPAPEPDSPQTTQPETGDSETFELKIDGEIRRLSRDEVIALAQKNGAVDNRLTEVNSLIDELKAAKSTARQADHDPAPAPADQSDAVEPEPKPDGSKPDQTTILGDEELDDIVERITVGDTDEAKGGVQKLVEIITKQVTATRPEQPAPDQIADLVSRTIVQQQQKSEIDTAIDDFTESYSDIVNDPLTAAAGVVATAEEMKADLRKVGMSDEQMATLGDDNSLISEAHRRVRAAGHNVRSLSEVLVAGGDKIRERFKLPVPGAEPNPDPDPAPVAADPQRTPPADPVDETKKRIVRKQSATKQPSTTTGREPLKSSSKRPKTADEIVASMRRQRGYAATS